MGRVSKLLDIKPITARTSADNVMQTDELLVLSNRYMSYTVVLPGVALLLLYPEAAAAVPLEAAADPDEGAYISLRAASLSCRLVTR